MNSELKAESGVKLLLNNNELIIKLGEILVGQNFWRRAKDGCFVILIDIDEEWPTFQYVFV